MKNKISMFLLIFCCTLNSCDISSLNWDLPKFAVVKTDMASHILDVSVECSGSITDDGGAIVTERGICYGTQPNPTIAINKVVCGSGIGDFGAIITGLKSNTDYYVRAYAITKVGTAYGSGTFFTTASLPTLTTNSVSSITLSSAQCGGNITKSGGLTVTQRGICWSTSKSPTTAANYAISGSGIGSYTLNFSGLTSNTIYYVRAFAVNSIGTAYGNEVNFTTASLPSLTTTIVSQITQVTAQSGGVITLSGSSNVTQRGIVFNTITNPTIANNKILSGSGIGSFTSSLSGLIPGTRYYIRSFATNSSGTSYGNELTFNTNPILVATLTTTAVTSVTINSAISGGNITNAGGGTVTARGICYGTSSNPTIANSIISSGSGTGSFTASMSGLNSGTTYYLRAYATNAAGTSYGNEISFTTVKISLPTLTTTAATSVTINSAISGGNITNAGGGTVTARGICYGTSSNPTIANSIISSGSGTGSFTASMSGLNSGTTYYIKAYATNGGGTAYGNEISFTTNSSFTIGQSYQGGIIFFVDGTNVHGLIAAPSDQSSGTTWGCSGISISNSIATAIGTGSSNTSAIVLTCTTSGIAARLCYDLVLGGYSDWYLPSISELNQMYINLKAQGFGNFADTYYWSSSQYSITAGYLQSFTANNLAYADKSGSYRVRAIRSF